MEDVKSFLNHDDENIRQLAEKLLEAEMSLGEGITLDQYNELVKDLIEAEEIRITAQNLKNKVRLLEAIKAIKILYGVITP